MEMRTIDKDGDWFINTAAFPMPDPTSGHTFFPGIKYKVKMTEWMANQPTIEPTDVEDEEVLDRVQKPKQPRGPRVDRSEGFVPSDPIK